MTRIDPILPSNTDLLNFMRQTPVLAGFDDRFTTEFARRCRVRGLQKGEILFLESHQADAAYLLRSGAISLFLTSFDGRDLVINEMQPGDVFGELAVLTGMPRSATAIAKVTSEVVAIPRQVFLTALDAEPRLARRLLQIVALRLASSSDRESSLAFADAEARLAELLLRLDKESSDTDSVIISQTELAQRLGLARQTVAAILGRWRRFGWLVTGRGRIILLRRDALQEYDQQQDR